MVATPARMSERAQELRRRIAEEIGSCGPISFERFMERALYEPELGYYAAGAGQSGPGVDFQTSPGVGPVFGRLLAVQVEECWRNLGEPEDFRIVEFGSGSLALARVLLEALEAAGAWPGAARYLAVDPHARAGSRAAGSSAAGSRAAEGRRARPRPAGEREALEALGGGSALVLSNEYVDALPVRRLVVRGGRAREIRVGLREGASDPGDPDPFVEVESDVQEEELGEALRALPELPEGFQFEVSLRARAWMRAVGRALERGYVLTLDYGYRRPERFHPERAAGTVLAYQRQRVRRELCARAGEQDLTSHVDFDDLIEAGREAGLELLGLTDQMRFLTALARPLSILEGEPGSAADWRDRFAFKELIMPGGMGTTLKVLVQARRVASLPLRGLQDPFAA